MSKLNKEFKSQVDETVREGTYITGVVGIRVFLVILVVGVLGGLGGLAYKATIGKVNKSVEREVFKESVAYTEQASSFLAKSYKEYNDAEDDTEKNTIMEYVIMRYPNLDTDLIDNDKLRQFYVKCLNN